MHTDDGMPPLYETTGRHADAGTRCKPRGPPLTSAEEEARSRLVAHLAASPAFLHETLASWCVAGRVVEMLALPAELHEARASFLAAVRSPSLAQQ